MLAALAALRASYRRGVGVAVLAIYSGIILPKGIVVKSPTAKIGYFVPNRMGRYAREASRQGRPGGTKLTGSSDRLEENHGQMTSTRGGEWWFAEEVKQRRVMRDKSRGPGTAASGGRYKVRLDLLTNGPRICSAVESAAAHLASQDLADSHQGQGRGRGRRGADRSGLACWPGGGERGGRQEENPHPMDPGNYCLRYCVG